MLADQLTKLDQPPPSASRLHGHRREAKYDGEAPARRADALQARQTRAGREEEDHRVGLTGL
jgi:hypothetical protein